MRLISQSAFALLATVAIASVPLEGCSGDETAPPPSGTGTGAGGATTAAGGSAAGGSAAGGTTSTGGTVSVGVGGSSGPAFCGGNKLYACGDTEDNDGDGLIDAADPDCLGPCDNTEDSFWPDLPGDSGQGCDLDCFWDTGQGHEELCYWNHQCDPHANDQSDLYNDMEATPQVDCAFSGSDAEQQSLIPPNDPGGLDCDTMFNNQDPMCLDECKPLAPNGCDCFGCCELGGQYVWIGSLDPTGSFGTCDLGDIGKPNFLEECHPCVPVPGCNNPCDPCELCVGKTELPPECGQGGGGGMPQQECDSGNQPCGLPDQPPCPSGQYCITGCCVDIIE